VSLKNGSEEREKERLAEVLEDMALSGKLIPRIDKELMRAAGLLRRPVSPALSKQDKADLKLGRLVRKIKDGWALVKQTGQKDFGWPEGPFGAGPWHSITWKSFRDENAIKPEYGPTPESALKAARSTKEKS
jgi:hypothetical protein